jgi:MGT family glycosyltransferase
MATVIIAVLPHASHYLPTLKLADDLTRSGHQVIYVSTEESQRGLVESHGFGFELLPVADFSTIPGSWTDGIPLAGPLLRARRFLRSLVSDLAGDAVPRMVDRLKPTLVVIESSLTLFALAVRALGTPVLSLSPFPQTAPGPSAPPPDCGLIPNGTNASKIQAEWKRYFDARARSERWYALLGLSQEAAERKLARLLDLDYGQTVDARRYHFHVLRGPELCMCPKEFDFPGSGREGWYTAGPGVFEKRSEPPFDFGFLTRGKPLVYCSMGTIFAERNRTRANLLRLVGSFAERTDIELIVSADPKIFDTVARGLPPHIRVFRHVPQLPVLARASVFLTHAGFSSVREAIFHGVPMLAMPLGADQQGVAARIEHHGLGLRMQLSDAAGKPLLDAFDTLLNDLRFRENCRGMQAVFIAEEKRNSAAQVIERLFNLKPRGEWKLREAATR